MPRTSNLFITSPRVGAPPAGEMSCLGFSTDTPDLTGGWWSELYSPGETWTPADHTPCSLLFFRFSFSTAPLFQPFFKCYFLFFIDLTQVVSVVSEISLFHFFTLYFYPNLHMIIPGRQDKKQEEDQDVNTCYWRVTPRSNFPSFLAQAVACWWYSCHRRWISRTCGCTETEHFLEDTFKSCITLAWHPHTSSHTPPFHSTATHSTWRMLQRSELEVNV